MLAQFLKMFNINRCISLSRVQWITIKLATSHASGLVRAALHEILTIVEFTGPPSGASEGASAPLVYAPASTASNNIESQIIHSGKYTEFLVFVLFDTSSMILLVELLQTQTQRYNV